jgi:hypothetical protein
MLTFSIALIVYLCYVSPAMVRAWYAGRIDRVQSLPPHCSRSSRRALDAELASRLPATAGIPSKMVRVCSF